MHTCSEISRLWTKSKHILLLNTEANLLKMETSVETLPQIISNDKKKKKKNIHINNTTIIKLSIQSYIFQMMIIAPYNYHSHSNPMLYKKSERAHKWESSKFNKLNLVKGEVWFSKG